jgi:glycosyltransferase involved in cell wall biosynthesis
MRELVLHVGKVAGISGSEAHLLSLLPGLRDRGWDARFCLLHEGEPGAYEFAERLVASEVPVYPLRLARDFDPKVFRRLRALIRERQPPLVHTHLVHADVYGLVAARLAGVPVLASTKHGFNPFRERRAFAAVDRKLGGLVDLHIAISAGLARYLAETEGFDPDAFEVVHYGIAAGPEPSSPPTEPRLLCVGRLIEIKGHMWLLDAVADARRAVPELTLDIAGEGPLRLQLQARVRELGLESAVRFLGRVTPIAPLLDAAAVVVVPSLGEGFGMAALEAAERGRPVIASAVGGLPEIVEDGRTGILVQRGDVRGLAVAIAALVDSPDRGAAMGREARRRALTAFSVDRCTSRTEELYDSALARVSNRSTAAAARSASTKSHGTR